MEVSEIPELEIAHARRAQMLNRVSTVAVVLVLALLFLGPDSFQSAARAIAATLAVMVAGAFIFYVLPLQRALRKREVPGCEPDKEI